MVRFTLLRRFSLATLFGVVTLVCVMLAWVVWEREVVRQRQELLLRTELRYSRVTPAATQSSWTPRSWVRRALGDTQVDSIILRDNQYPMELEQLTVAFPEAEVRRNNSLASRIARRPRPR